MEEIINRKTSLETLAKIAYVLGYTVEIKLVPLDSDERMDSSKQENNKLT
jgi:hypothetical protein